MNAFPECPKCRVAMERGYQLDHSHGGQVAGEWVEGAPRKSFWTGLSTSGRQHIEITAWRCPQCGYLESYAVSASQP